MLWKAYSQKCPIDTLQDIIEKYLHEGPLQKHLLYWISSFNKKPDAYFNGTGFEPASYSYQSFNEELLKGSANKSIQFLTLKLHNLLNFIAKNDKITEKEIHYSICNLAWETKNPFFIIIAYAIVNKRSKFSGFAMALNILAYDLINSRTIDKNSEFYEQLRVNKNFIVISNNNLILFFF